MPQIPAFPTGTYAPKKLHAYLFNTCIHALYFIHIMYTQYTIFLLTYTYAEICGMVPIPKVYSQHFVLAGSRNLQSTQWHASCMCSTCAIHMSAHVIVHVHVLTGPWTDVTVIVGQIPLLTIEKSYKSTLKMNLL